MYVCGAFKEWVLYFHDARDERIGLRGRGLLFKSKSIHTQNMNVLNYNHAIKEQNGGRPNFPIDNKT